MSTSSSQGISLEHYHIVVSQWLRDNLSWLTQVESYPDASTVLTTRVCITERTFLECSPQQPMNDQHRVTLHGEIRLVAGREESTGGLLVRQYAMAVSQAVDQNRFGLTAEPAQLINAQPGNTASGVPGYAVWSIRFNQEIDTGDDSFDVSGVIPETVYLGYQPETWYRTSG
ncbi:hypothetical protein P4S72_03415 [Vibrio sp. PP-XX7]